MTNLKELYEKHVDIENQYKLNDIKECKENCEILKNTIKNTIEEMKTKKKPIVYLNNLPEIQRISSSCFDELKKELPNDKIKIKRDTCFIHSNKYGYKYLIIQSPYKISVEKGWLGYYWQFECL